MYETRPTIPDDSPGRIRFFCKKPCPHECTNYGEWKYYDRNEEDGKEWTLDSTLRLTCQTGKHKCTNHFLMTILITCHNIKTSLLISI